MNVSYRWLRALAPGLADPPERVAERLTLYGAPVDEVVRLDAPFAGLLAARVVAVRPHPGADRLVLCDVDAGPGGVRPVVCGAPNVRAGGLYPYAPPGTVLPGGVPIRTARIRGVESEGMLLSERELGLGRDHTGLLELPAEARPGQPLAEALGLDDVRFVLDVTPNRPDLLSHYGVARELAPGGEAGLVLPPVGADGDVLATTIAFARAPRAGAAGGVEVAIEDPRGCPRYLGAVVRGVTVRPSPPWLAARLRAVGLRPINNVVDATNYVLYELGQPLHAFDLDRLAGPAIRVRRAAPGETIVTLDGERRTLSEDMLVIADAERAVAVAGVMGGEETEVREGTRNIFLECALFDPRVVRRTARGLALSTDASYRFERGADPEGLERAARRALALLVALAGGEVEPEGADICPEPILAPVIPLRPARVAQVLGTRFAPEALVALLEPLGFRVPDPAADPLPVRVPGHRVHDVRREIDLIEEVARRHGYDAFPAELGPFRPSAVPDDPLPGLELRLRQLFLARGFLEARSSPLAPEGEGDVPLLNPLSAAESRLRRALAPGLLHRVEHNFAHGVRHVRLFEIGTAFAPGPTPADPPVESTRLAAAFTGARHPPHWSGPAAAFDVWDLKGLLLELADALGLEETAVEPAGEPPAPFYAPGLAFLLRAPDGGLLGAGGRVAPHAIDAPAWADPVWALELELRPALATREPPTFRPLPAFPAIERDLALLVPDELPAARVEATLREAAGPLLEAVAPFDLYRGRGIPAGTRSIAYRLRLRAPDRTLTDAEADAVVARVLRRLKDELHVERRG